jgi:phage terminase large subunit
MNRAEFKTHWGSTVYFRTGKIPDSAEGIPRVRRVWLDEGGKVTRYFWENLEGRAAPLSVPIDITTTPYAMNWLARMVKDARRGKRTDVSIVHCRAVESPYFSKDEYERQKRLLDPVRFRMKYDGEFGQMEGLVYPHYEDCLIQSRKLESARLITAVSTGATTLTPFAL